MRKAAQKIRVVAIVFGVVSILFGIASHIWGYILVVQSLSQQMINGQLDAQLNSQLNSNFLNLIYGIAASVSTGMLPILVTLLINPDKVADLFDKQPEESTEDEPVTENAEDAE